jgi:hypothetical protein
MELRLNADTIFFTGTANDNEDGDLSSFIPVPGVTY